MSQNHIQIEKNSALSRAFFPHATPAVADKAFCFNYKRNLRTRHQEFQRLAPFHFLLSHPRSSASWAFCQANGYNCHCWSHNSFFLAYCIFARVYWRDFFAKAAALGKNLAACAWLFEPNSNSVWHSPWDLYDMGASKE